MSTAAAPLELQGAYVPPQRITIASIYPIECVTHIARRAPKQSFPVPAGTKEKPGLLVVEDTWESGGTLDKPVNHRILAQHTAKHIVDDLTVYLFEAHAASRSYPGIFICAGDYPTPEEIADAE
ncbi:MAG TPA: hypothetical protein VE958_11530, partial [Bryobacteraceae bacterium]|nr:hypothetical protein [Bryobacteraceae bacterium]